MKEFDFKHFILYLKKIMYREYLLTRVMIRILIKIIKLKNPPLKSFAYYQFFNTIKMLFVFVVFMFPMGSWLVMGLLVLKFKYNVNLLPDTFNKDKYHQSLKKYHDNKLINH